MQSSNCRQKRKAKASNLKAGKNPHRAVLGGGFLLLWFVSGGETHLKKLHRQMAMHKPVGANCVRPPKSDKTLRNDTEVVPYPRRGGLFP